MEGFDSVLTAARAGADWAWRRIYADLAPRVIAYLRAQGAADPEDLAGEVFLQLVRDLGRFSGDADALRAFAFTIAHRRLIDDRRRRGRRPATPTDPEVLAQTAGAGGDVAQEALGALDEARVREAIEGLPGDQRAVLLLRILGDLTIDEIAAAIGKRRGAVKALQRRALRRLEKAYPFDEPRR